MFMGSGIVLPWKDYPPVLGIACYYLLLYYTSI
jgi:hypothetical protein